jgi:hypothetical protein
MTIRHILRCTIAATAIAALLPIGMAVLDLTPSALAGNGNGKGHSDGKGQGSHGNHGSSGGKQSSSGGNKGQAKKAEKMAAKMNRQTIEEDPSMAPGALGKLNGVLNASLTALQHANPSSPVGMAGTTLREALLAAETANSDLDPYNDVTPEELAAELADIFDGMTNKTLTEAQVLSVLDRMAELDPTLSKYDLDADQLDGVPEANQALAEDVAEQVNSFDLAASVSDMFDGDEPEDETQAE